MFCSSFPSTRQMETLAVCHAGVSSPWNHGIFKVGTDQPSPTTNFTTQPCPQWLPFLVFGSVPVDKLLIYEDSLVPPGKKEIFGSWSLKQLQIIRNFARQIEGNGAKSPQCGARGDLKELRDTAGRAGNIRTARYSQLNRGKPGKASNRTGRLRQRPAGTRGQGGTGARLAGSQNSLCWQRKSILLFLRPFGCGFLMDFAPSWLQIPLEISSH